MKNAVTEISFIPGSNYGLIFIRLLENRQTYSLYLNHSESDIRVDGVRHSYAELLIRLFNSNLSVVLHPREELYGVSTKAEFISAR